MEGKTSLPLSPAHSDATASHCHLFNLKRKKGAGKVGKKSQRLTTETRTAPQPSLN